jgi:hypothetical protein
LEVVPLQYFVGYHLDRGNNLLGVLKKEWVVNLFELYCKVWSSIVLERAGHIILSLASLLFFAPI